VETEQFNDIVDLGRQPHEFEIAAAFPRPARKPDQGTQRRTADVVQTSTIQDYPVSTFVSQSVQAGFQPWKGIRIKGSIQVQEIKPALFLSFYNAFPHNTSKFC
jgi:hypothetical protein